MFNFNFITKQHWDASFTIVKKIIETNTNRDLNLHLLREFSDLVECEKQKDKVFEIFNKHGLLYLYPQHFSSDKVDVTKDISEYREYRFLTFWGMVQYYATVLFISDCYRSFDEPLKKSSKICAISPSDFQFTGTEYQHKDNYRENYNEFVKKIEEESKQNRYILKLDIRKYFNSISHRKLIDKIFSSVPHSTATIQKLDSYRESLYLYLDCLVMNTEGIPQARKNLASNFLGHSFLRFLDYEVEKLANDSLDVEFICYTRYMDDIYLFFESGVLGANEEKTILEIEQKISYWLMQELELGLNHSKTRIIHLSNQSEIDDFLAKFKEITSKLPADDDINHTFEKYVANLKQINIEFLKNQNFSINDKQRNILKNIFKKGFPGLLNKKTSELKQVIDSIDFELTIPSLDVLSPLFFLKNKIKVEEVEGFEFPFVDGFNRFISKSNSESMIIKPQIEALIEWYVHGENDSTIDEIVLKFANQLQKDNLGKYLLKISGFDSSQYTPSFSLSSISQSICGERHKFKDSFSRIRDDIYKKINGGEDLRNAVNQLCLFVIRYNEGEYSVAINHFHSFIEEILCKHLGIEDTSSVNMNSIYRDLFTKNKKFSDGRHLDLALLTDRRNFNPVSHPSKKGIMASPLELEEVNRLVLNACKAINILEVI